MRSLLLGALVATSALGALAYAATAADATADYLVHPTPEGVPVLDNYGTFATARLTAPEAARLSAAGYSLAPIESGTGRGAYATTDAIPENLLADAKNAVFLVEYRGPVKAEWRAALDLRADAVYDYLPHHAFLARLDAAARDALAAMPEVRAITPYHPAYKLAPELATEGIVDATALVYLDESLEAALAEIALAGGTPTAWTTAQLEHVVDFTIHASRLADVARIDAVSWIEPAINEGSLDNAAASAITQGGATTTYPVHDRGVDGSSQLASVCDTGTNTSPVGSAVNVPNVGTVAIMEMTHEMHDDSAQGLLAYNAHLLPAALPLPHRKMDLYYSPVENNVVRGDSDDSSGHGTHTSGTIAGDAPPYAARNGNDGVAFNAKLLVCDVTTGGSFNILNNYANYWNPAYARGARINSNSWGGSHTNSYTEVARQHDAYVWDHRDMLILRSMGNTGATGSIRPEAVAKSAYGSGATGNGANMENLASFSTGGLPTDGRMKPNGVAPGDCLTSSYLSAANSYACVSGTSMSTPTTAGAATLVRDYFKKGYYPSGNAVTADAKDITTAALRGALQISGKEITGDRGITTFPNKAQGWGRVTLENVLYFAGDAKKLVFEDEGTGLSTGGTYVKTVTVAAGQPLRIMIAWSDQAGAAGANPALVNNLDLTVVGPAGTYKGNAFTTNEVAPNQGVADARNVEEAVYVNAPAAGTYTITVTGTNVPSGPQPFALLATGGVS